MIPQLIRRILLVCLVATAAGVTILFLRHGSRPDDTPQPDKVRGMDRAETIARIDPLGPASPYDSLPVFRLATGQNSWHAVVDVSMPAQPAQARTGTPTWQSLPLGLHSGPFRVEFDVVPHATPINALIGLAAAPIAAETDCPVLIRFNSSGRIDVRSGATYGADVVLPYTPGLSYHFELAVDPLSRTYSVYVTPLGGWETPLATRYAFGAGQADVASIAYWGLQASSGSHTVSGLRLGTEPLTVDAGQDVAIQSGSSIALAGLVSGGMPPYTYNWSPSTGLSRPGAVNPVASPATTTTYTLTATDSLGRTASDTVTITVAASPGALVANAGGDLAIPTGGAGTLNGSASGGTAPYAYAWSPAVGLSATTVAQPTVRPTVATRYTLTLRDAAGRVATDTAMVTIAVPTSGPVYYVSPTGNDNNAGTAAAPWRTLAKAASLAGPGATVIVKAGQYNETLMPLNSGTADNPITFRSEVIGGAILDGQYVREYGVDLTRPSSYVRIEGFEIRHHTADGVTVNDWYSRTTRGIQVVNCYIHDNAGDGVNFRNSQDSLVAGCEITRNGQTAIAIGGQTGSTNLVLRSNRIHRNTKDGIQGSSINLIVEYNVLYDQCSTDAHQDALQLDTYQNATIRYNLIGDFTQLIYGGPEPGASGKCDDLQVYGNVFYNSVYWRLGGVDGGNGTCPAIYIDSERSGPGSTITGVQIYNNTFLYLGDKQEAILLWGNENVTMDDARIYNNIFYQCRGASPGKTYDIDPRFRNVRADYNCYYGTRPLAGQDAHSIQADPQLVNYTQAASVFDVHLRPGSPCINAGARNLGSLVILPKPYLDIDGNVRPAGGHFDIGATEMPQATNPGSG